ncbi:Pimeloyl-ACP methyl ester carboxylesterase [Halopseudomonas xinjiangensis]|uniref:Pimeloyl-ACP methyl ester carboxylesterase n=1 Tax=Halopseudomonas xinjiangensis TaxID=487184 RepID=A0A1H1MWC5_9GAMM|nr:alpha/beta hydrolase [Halopseudomonas xinjiangensis]SDR91024.1 Pimeloyl-ACP methyl ester carboxylesterase [Halopseudomonas xinjiangensis]
MTDQQILHVNDIDLSVHFAGPETGKPVWLLHGFPECWYSWRHQMAALADAGFRVCVPEMRGYGRTSAPQPIEAYDLITLCSDIQAAMDHLGHTEVAMVGHDWGAPVAWHLALLEPERVKVVCGMSVPFGGRPKRPAIDIMREHFKDRFHYILYFQEPGRAEQELEADIPRTLRLAMHGLSESGKSNALFNDKPADARWLEDRVDPGVPPEWCPPDAFDVYVATFERCGFRGPLNWYRNFQRSWERTADLAGLQIEQPALFLIGDRDPVGEMEAYTIQKMPSLVPKVEQHVFTDCGHWIQGEQAEEVNRLLLEFLGRTYT